MQYYKPSPNGLYVPLKICTDGQDKVKKCDTDCLYLGHIMKHSFTLIKNML